MSEAPTGWTRRARIAWWWLLIAFAQQTLVGVSAAVAYDSALWAPHRERMARALWGTPEIPKVAWPVVEQLCAMLGATIVCWGVAMLWVVWGPLRRGEAWSRWCILTSLLSWSVLDTSLSAWHGVWVNVGFNVMATVMIGAPLWMLWGAPPEAPPSPPQGA